MSFDPDQPAESSPLTSAVMRGQLTSLHDLITAIHTITAAQVDGVSTVNPGDPATASVSVIGNTLHFTFAIPQGIQGSAGQNGQDGGPGPVGPQGPPFANAVVDGVTTLPAGSNASVTVSFDGTHVHFAFEIPQGAQGIQGFQGEPGEVTNAALNAAINGTSANSNTVPTIDTPFTNDPPTLADMETLRAAYNTLVQALRRA